MNVLALAGAPVALFCGIVWMGTAFAGQPSMEGLARAVAAEQRCQSLSLAERQQLQVSLNSNKAKLDQDEAIARGQAVGSKARCDDTTKRAIRAVLEAARNSTSAATGQTDSNPQMLAAVPPASQDSVTEQPDNGTQPPAAKSSVKPKRTANTSSKQTSNTGRQKTLADYGSMVEAYYVELNCGSMSVSGINNLYDDVMRAHRRMVALFGPGPTGTTVRRAEARAKSRGC